MKIKSVIFLFSLVFFITSFAKGSCDDLVKLGMDNISYKSRTSFHQDSINYFNSDEFAKDLKDQKFGLEVIVYGYPIKANYSDTDLHIWRQQIESFQSENVDYSAEVTFLRSRGQVEVAKLMVECELGNLKIIPTIITVNKEVFVKFDWDKSLKGGASKIVRITTLNCNEIGESLKSEDYMPSNGVSGKFSITDTSKKGLVVIETESATGYAILDEHMPTPPPTPPPAPDFVWKKLTIAQHMEAFPLTVFAGDGVFSQARAKVDCNGEASLLVEGKKLYLAYTGEFFETSRKSGDGLEPSRVGTINRRIEIEIPNLPEQAIEIRVTSAMSGGKFKSSGDVPANRSSYPNPDQRIYFNFDDVNVSGKTIVWRWEYVMAQHMAEITLHPIKLEYKIDKNLAGNK